MKSASFTLALLFACPALGAWGLKYEVWSGTDWTSNQTVNVASGAVDINFRISIWNDGLSSIAALKPKKGVKAPIVAANVTQPLRLQSSSRISNWGSIASGDQLRAFNVTVPASGRDSTRATLTGPDTVLGVAGSKTSFASNLTPKRQVYGQFIPLMTYFQGTMRIGNRTAAARDRTITLNVDSLGAASPNSGNGGVYGASFYGAFPDRNEIAGTIREEAVNFDATIHVISSGARGVASANLSLPAHLPAPPTIALTSSAFLATARRRR